MKDKIQAYLNSVNWSTITVLTEKFSITRQDVAQALAEMLADQDVRIYSGEIVHI